MSELVSWGPQFAVWAVSQDAALLVAIVVLVVWVYAERKGRLAERRERLDCSLRNEKLSELYIQRIERDSSERVKLADAHSLSLDSSQRNVLVWSEQIVGRVLSASWTKPAGDPSDPSDPPSGSVPPLPPRGL